jgi:pyridinium-3,5-biscarboxylic acid mononucleotide sulfurtransferase
MLETLHALLRSIATPIIAVSGGVDSVTLAAVAAQTCEDTLLVHAASPAVPREATERLQRLAAERHWNLQIVDAGEFTDARYRANPLNRCFFCKSNLYETIAALTDRQILSGANLDDLGEYRPGLDAARLHSVRHPYIEAQIGKQTVRAIARDLGLQDIAELPASPCLSSRVETGIRIEEATLAFIHAVERQIQTELSPRTVRCRVRAGALVVELDEATLYALTSAAASRVHCIVNRQPNRPVELPVLLQPYRNGSAFLRTRPA